jgi:hypothetical protein
MVTLTVELRVVLQAPPKVWPADTSPEPFVREVSGMTSSTVLPTTNSALTPVTFKKAALTETKRNRDSTSTFS